MPKLPQLLRDAVAGEAARLRERLVDTLVGLMALAIAALIALIGIVFLFVGIYGSLAGHLPAWQAGAIVAVAILILAGLIVLWARRRMRRRPSSPPVKASPDAAVAAEIRRATEQGIGAGESLSRGGLSAMDLTLAAFVAGLVVSRTTRSRKRRDEGDT